MKPVAVRKGTTQERQIDPCCDLIHPVRPLPERRGTDEGRLLRLGQVIRCLLEEILRDTDFLRYEGGGKLIYHLFEFLKSCNFIDFRPQCLLIFQEEVDQTQGQHRLIPRAQGEPAIRLIGQSAPLGMKHDETRPRFPEGLPHPVGRDEMVIRIQIPSGDDNAVTLDDIIEVGGEIILPENLFESQVVWLQTEPTGAIDVVRPHHLPHEPLQQIGLLISAAGGDQAPHGLRPAA